MPAEVTVVDRKIALFDLDDTLVDYQGWKQIG
jgi:FMN phosphatase YigB (HAD superfamily)